VDYGTIANPLFQMGQELFKPPTNSTIQIGSNVLITGGTVNIQTWAGESIAEQNYANSRSSFWKDFLNDATNDLNTGFGALPVSILIRQPAASITQGQRAVCNE
jgi:hypothetical protein